MMFPKPKTYRSKGCLSFIKTKPCIICGNPDSEPHHEPLGHGGKGIKAPDNQALPMCRSCHVYRHHIGVGFWDDNNIDPKLEIIKLNAEYMHIKGI